MRVLLLTHSSFHEQHSTRMKPHPTGVAQLGLQAHTAERSSRQLLKPTTQDKTTLTQVLLSETRVM